MVGIATHYVAILGITLSVDRRNEHGLRACLTQAFVAISASWSSSEAWGGIPAVRVAGVCARVVDAILLLLLRGRCGCGAWGGCVLNTYQQGGQQLERRVSSTSEGPAAASVAV